MKSIKLSYCYCIFLANISIGEDIIISVLTVSYFYTPSREEYA